MEQLTALCCGFWSAIPKVRYSESLLFPLNLRLTLTLNLILTLTSTLALILVLWHVSAQWTFEIADLPNSGPVPRCVAKSVISLQLEEDVVSAEFQLQYELICTCMLRKIKLYYNDDQ